MLDVTGNAMKAWKIYTLSVACIVLVLSSAVIGWADYQSARAIYIVAKWQRGNAVESDEWNKAERLMQNVLFWHVNNPDYIEALAQLHHWRNAQTNIEKSDVQQNFKISLQYYRRATILRPLRPNAWANVALMKSHLQQWDGEFEFAFEQALKLGAWENNIQLVLHEAGLVGWRNTNINTRPKAFINYKNSFKNGARQVELMMRLTERYDLQRVFCFYARQQFVGSEIKTLISRRCL